MKKILLSVLLFSSFGAFSQDVNIPDGNFKNYLVTNGAINTNGDSEIQVSEAVAYTGTIYCVGLLIADLTGIEAFTNITQIHCQDNNITAVDLSGNTALERLFSSGNELTSLDVSTNPVLIILRCYDNNISSLNVANGNNVNMGVMEAHSNPNLTCIQTDQGIVGTNPAGWTKDSTATYNDNCSLSTNGFQEVVHPMNLFPNPTKGIVNIESEVNIEAITVYNLAGQSVMEFEGVKTIDVSELPNGMYTLKIITGGSSPVVKRLIKY